MSKSAFGWWGNELDDNDFACALAALGVAEAHYHCRPVPSKIQELKIAIDKALSRKEAVPWTLIGPPEEFVDYARMTDASTLRDAWKAGLNNYRGRIRLEIQPERGGGYSWVNAHLPWLVDQLSNDAVGLASTYVLDEIPGPTKDATTKWNWPVRIGYFSDFESLSLSKNLHESWLIDELAIIRPMVKSNDTCDMLLLPWPLREALNKLLGMSFQIRASCVVILGGLDEPWERALHLIDAMKSQAGSAGVCVTTVPATSRENWFTILVEGLSHNQPLDVCFHRTSSWINQELTLHPMDSASPLVPLFFSTRRLLAVSQIKSVAYELCNRMEGLTKRRAIRVPEKAAERLRIRSGSFKSVELAHEIRNRIESFYFEHESNEASGVADIGRAVESSMLRMGALERKPRWIQAQVFRTNKGESKRITRALKADEFHTLIVRIGPIDREWLTPPKEAVFPEHKLPQNEEVNELQVIFSEPVHVSKPLTAEIALPRLGASTTCQFAFRPKRSQTLFEGRIVVLHQNRILQTALLRAQVLKEPTKANKSAKIKLDIEALVRPDLAGLEARQRFDAALVVNRGNDGVPRLTKIVGDRAELLSLEGLKDALQSIKDKISEIATNPRRFPQQYNAKATEELLRFLAVHGRDLYEGIVTDQLGTGPLTKAGRIQLLCARESFLPLEFLYDQPVPRPDAKICPESKQALKTKQKLRNGKCIECILTDKTPSPYICPLGFWCLSKVIERHAHDPEISKKFRGMDFALQAEPFEDRNALHVFDGAVYAASNRVDKFEKGLIKKVHQSLEESTNNNASLVKSWDRWIAEIKQRHPTLLVLLPHILRDEQFSKPTLEIEESDQLISTYINKKYVCPLSSERQPIVVLLGCETLDTDIPFQGFVAKFRRNGAAIVLSTLTPVLGRQVVPIAQMLIKELRYATKSVSTFGDAFLELRRHALAQGKSVVLSLVAYGDADWRLNPQNA